MQLNTNTHLKSRDLYFCSYIFARGYKLTAIEPDESGLFYWFIFEEKEKCEQEEQKFLRNEAVIKAKDYSEAIKYLKRKVSQ